MTELHIIVDKEIVQQKLADYKGMAGNGEHNTRQMVTEYQKIWDDILYTEQNETVSIGIKSKEQGIAMKAINAINNHTEKGVTKIILHGEKTDLRFLYRQLGELKISAKYN